MRGTSRETVSCAGGRVCPNVLQVRGVGPVSLDFMRSAALIFSVLASGAFAQGPATPPPVEKAAVIPDPVKIQKSADSLQRMREVLKDVLGKLEEARNTKDVVKLNCVNEKLSSIKGLLRISEQADVALQEAVAKKEPSQAEHEYTKVSIARQKVDQLRAEAEECIGQLAFRTDENLSVEVETPTDLPNQDVTNPEQPPPLMVRPPPASPTQ